MPRRIGHELDVGRLQVGTRQALADKGRHSLTVTLSELSARMLGVLIALFERTVGYYAKLIHANACHQPGVESGKRAAAQILALQKRLLSALSDEPKTATELCARSDAPKDHFAAQLGAECFLPSPS